MEEYKLRQEHEAAWDRAIEANEAFDIRRAEASEPFASEMVWGLMGPEQRQSAGELRLAIADQFKEYGVTADRLRVLMYETLEGDNVFTLVLTGKGVDIGKKGKDNDPERSYDGVMSDKNDNLFKVSVDGRTHDTREGMTDMVYRALYEDAIERKTALPDSIEMLEKPRDPLTTTMLTGEPLTPTNRAWFRGVDNGTIVLIPYERDYGGRGLRVRPAVVFAINPRLQDLKAA